jgi:KAP-like P-loop domain-containing protein/carboxypeptidase family protein
MKKGEDPASDTKLGEGAARRAQETMPSDQGGRDRRTLFGRMAATARSAVFSLLPFLARVPRLAMLGMAAALLTTIAARESSTPPLAPGEATPRLLGSAWWTTPRQTYGERALPAFDNATIEAVEVAPVPSTSGKPPDNRLWIAGDAGLLAYSDDEGTTWTTFHYDSTSGVMLEDAPASVAMRAPLFGWRVEASEPQVQQQPVAQQQANPPALTGKEVTAAVIGTVTDPSGARISGATITAINTNKGTISGTTTTTVAGLYSLRGLPAGTYDIKAERLGFPTFVRKGITLKPTQTFRLDIQIAVSQVSQTVTVTQQVQNLPVSGRRFQKPFSSLGLSPPPVKPPDWLATALRFRAFPGAAILTAPNGYQLYSDDSGTTWTRVAGPGVETAVGAKLTPGQPILVGSLIAVPENPATVRSAPAIRFSNGRELRTVYRSGSGGRELTGRNDSTANWQVESPGPNTQVFGLASREPNTAWAAGNEASLGGVIYRSDDQGRTWTRQFARAGFELRDITFEQGGKAGFAAGTQGAILRTRDGGTHWIPVTLGAAAPGKRSTDFRWWQRPVRIPAPLSLFGILLALVVLIPAVLPETVRIAVVERSIASIAVSDAPITSTHADELGFTPVARAIAGLLRNKATGLPLTVAITAPWGRGKTSLMSLVQQELRSSGWRTVCFNAWHHQEDASVLASLLQTVRSEAPPELLARGGLRYRIRLLARRLWRWRTLWVLIAVAALYFAEAAVHDHNPHMYANAAKYLYEVTSGTPAAQAGAGEKGGEKPGILQVIARMLVDLTEHSQDTGAGHLAPLAVLVFLVLLLTLQVMQSFGANPAELLARSSDRKTVKGMEAQTRFLEKFRKQYGEVVEALGKYRLAIFVDDLDRCRPDKIAEMLEAANYLMAAGPCALVMALEERAVIIGLGLSFSRMAEELGTLPDNHKSAQGDLLGAAREKREAFAQNYVEKLLNIVVKAPPAASTKFAQLLTGAGRHGRLLQMPRDRRWRWVADLARVPAAAIILGALLFAGNNLFRAWLGSQPTAVVIQPPQQGSQNAAPNQASQSGRAGNLQATQASSPAAPSTPPKYAAAERPLPGAWFESWWQRLLWGLLALSLGLSFSLRRPPPSVADTPEFEEALNIWAPVLGAAKASPRFAKRVLNRLRYLATLEREAGNEVDSRIPETVLVMLGVLDAVPPNFLDTSDGLGHFLRDEAASKLPGSDVQNMALRAWAKHKERFGPISADLLLRYRHRFEELSEGIVAR